MAKKAKKQLCKPRLEWKTNWIWPHLSYQNVINLRSALCRLYTISRQPHDIRCFCLIINVKLDLQADRETFNTKAKSWHLISVSMGIIRNFLILSIRMLCKILKKKTIYYKDKYLMTTFYSEDLHRIGCHTETTLDCDVVKNTYVQFFLFQYINRTTTNNSVHQLQCRRYCFTDRRSVDSIQVE